MVMPPGHGSEAQRLRPLLRREKWLAGGIGGVLAVGLLVVLLVSLTHADRKSGHGCIAVSLAYSMGGTQDYHCGAAARRMCSDVNRPGLTGAAGRDTAVACRKAGLPVG
jgi:K+-transporting ATPase KdpF subunit